MSELETIGSRRNTDAEARRQLEGEDRIASLPAADFLALTVGDAPDSPVTVFIGWTTELVEHAYPGTAIWRAAVERYLASPATADPADPIVRVAARDSLARFPTLDRWLTWSDNERQQSSPASASHVLVTRPAATGR